MKQGLRIRFQSLLAITPVFLLLAVGINTLIGYLVYRETQWGLEEGVSSVMITAAAMLDRDAFRQYAAAAPEDPTRRRVTDPVKAILQLKQLTGIRAFSADKRELFGQVCPTCPAAEFLPDSLIPFDAGTAQVRLVSDAQGRFWISGAVPVTGNADSLLGYLAVQKNAQLLEERRKAFIHKALERGLVALCLGIICAFLISYNLKKRISSLQRAIRKIGQARYDVDLSGQTGIIREMNDLGSSFNTMASILKDTVSRGKRHLTGVARHDRQAELAARLCFPDRREYRFDGQVLYLQPVGAAGPENFAEISADESRLLCVFGRGDAAGGFEGAVRVSSFTRYLTGLILSDRTETDIAAACELFSVQELTVVILEKGSAGCRISRFTGTACTGTETRQPGAQPLVLHNLGPVAEERFTLYCREFCLCRTTHLLQELVRLVEGPDGAPPGMLVMITRETETTT